MDRAAVKTALFTRLDQACANQPRRDLAFDPPLKRIARLEATAPVFMAMAREALRQTNAERAAAQLERAKQVAVVESQRAIAKGTLARRQRGELVQEDRPDLGSDAEYKPTIRGARRRDPLRELLGIRNAHRPHDGANADDARLWTAAQTFRALVEIAGGAKTADASMERVDFTAAPGGTTDRQLDAIGAVRRMKQAMAADYPVVRWVVEEYGGVDEFAVVAGITTEDAKKRLISGLDVIVDRICGYREAIET